MRTSTAVLGAVLLAIGGVWIFQGIGALRGSFMTGSSFWLWVGVACAVTGALVLVWALTSGKA